MKNLNHSSGERKKSDPLLGRMVPAARKESTKPKKTKKPKPRPQLHGLPKAFHEDEREDVYYGD